MTIFPPRMVRTADAAVAASATGESWDDEFVDSELAGETGGAAHAGVTVASIASANTEATARRRIGSWLLVRLESYVIRSASTRYRRNSPVLSPKLSTSWCPMRWRRVRNTLAIGVPSGAL